MNAGLPVNISLVDDPQQFRSRLLAWFDANGRSLPWRRDRSLYGTWICEVMLQQTTVAVVVPYWERFLATFPDVQALAAADPETVLAQWSGLGYYRRARQLHDAARMVVSRMGGKLPDTHEGWLELPGIGPYSGGAIASIGLGIRVPALDANARRVLTRWLVADPADLSDLKGAHLDQIGFQFVDQDRPGDWNEALMELGALICRAPVPRCRECPTGDLCRAGRAGTADLIPAAKAPARTEKVQLGLLVLFQDDKVLLVPPASGPAVVPVGGPKPIRQDVSGLHKGLWGLPATPWMPDFPVGSTVWPGRIWRTFLEAVSGRDSLPGGNDPTLWGTFRHAITRYRLEVQVYGLQLPGAGRQGLAGLSEPHFSHAEQGNSRFVEGESPVARGARFCHWRPLGLPVSNLVNKSLAIAEKSIV